MRIDPTISSQDLLSALDGVFDLAAKKTLALAKRWRSDKGAPVFTQRGRYTARGWTDWTQGFQFGCQILLFDATGDEHFLEMGLKNTRRHIPSHLTHTGVHDHGFNVVSTYGNLRRLSLEGRLPHAADGRREFELALKVSGAVQAMRWTTIADGTGFVHSFNGPHSLFSDTVRSCRSLVLAHLLGHRLVGEGDRSVSLLRRAVEHLTNTIRFNVYFGKKRDAYDDEPGRVAHESIFNVTDGDYRCPSTQQGYAPFTTWTRGLAWVLLGLAEELECFRQLPDEEFEPFGGRDAVVRPLLRAARATADYHIRHSASDGIPYWDTGAPGLAHMPDWREEAARPDNDLEPVDSSAAAIAAQGFLRLGRYLGARSAAGKRYRQAGFTLATTLFAPPYLSEGKRHEGLILHSIYHRPNGWDYVPKGKSVPQGESSMWGDYHALELAVYLKREVEKRPYLTFFGRT